LDGTSYSSSCLRFEFGWASSVPIWKRAFKLLHPWLVLVFFKRSWNLSRGDGLPVEPLLGPEDHKRSWLGFNPVVCRLNSRWPSPNELDLGVPIDCQVRSAVVLPKTLIIIIIIIICYSKKKKKKRKPTLSDSTTLINHR